MSSQGWIDSPSTVYRTIKYLVEGNLLTEIEGVNDKHFFAIKLGNEIGESTLICTDCDSVFPVNNPCLALREADVARKMDLTPSRVVLKIESTRNELKKTGMCEHQKPSGAQSKS
jgi:Fe2+ or Zn2+ uptake regulation protein